MIYELDPHYPGFPNPEESEPDGLIAIGGDLSPERLINAYCCGIFPWYDDSEPILWWSLDPRMVLFPDKFRYSKSLRRVVQSGKFEVRIDTRFEEVMRSCGNVDRTAQGQSGTWITEEMVSAYVCLHRLGLAHSFETYYQGQLVGGLYGVSLGPFFFGESMFHTRAHHFRLIDAQQETPHLASLGARPIPRSEYLMELNAIRGDNTLQGNWGEYRKS